MKTANNQIAINPQTLAHLITNVWGSQLTYSRRVNHAEEIETSEINRMQDLGILLAKLLKGNESLINLSMGQSSRIRFEFSCIGKTYLYVLFTEQQTNTILKYSETAENVAHA